MKIAIYGPGGFGREVAPLAYEIIRSKPELGDPNGGVYFISDDTSEHGHLNGFPVVGLEHLSKEYALVLAVSDASVRRILDEKCEARGYGFGSIQAPTAQLRGPSQIGVGAILCDFVVITANVRIGRHFHANLHSYVAHDCVIGDFVTLAPKACINGNVVLGDGVYVGTGAVIKQGLKVGHGAVIGMGAVVTKDVDPGCVVVGNPARAR